MKTLQKILTAGAIGLAGVISAFNFGGCTTQKEIACEEAREESAVSEVTPKSQNPLEEYKPYPPLEAQEGILYRNGDELIYLNKNDGREYHLLLENGRVYKTKVFSQRKTRNSREDGEIIYRDILFYEYFDNPEERPIPKEYVQYIQGKGRATRIEKPNPIERFFEPSIEKGPMLSW